MYEKFYGFREKPFSMLPDPQFLYPSRKHQLALAQLEYGLWNQSTFIVVTGGIGTGKTTLIRYLLNQLDEEFVVGLISNTHASFGELMHWILNAFNLPCSDDNQVGLYRVFSDFLIDQYANNRRTVLIIDEAQNMTSDTLEELRLLSNINSEKDQVLQIVLSGQVGLRKLLCAPGLEQFAQRIAVDYHLQPLDREETRHYIRHRITVAGGDPDLFEDDACHAAYHFSGGIPRLINVICDTALVYGFAGQNEIIDRDLVNEVGRDKQKSGIFPMGGSLKDQASKEM